MKAVLNRQLLEQTSFDSSGPSGSAVVVHRFDEVGEYSLKVLQEEHTVANLSLTVVAEVVGKGQPPEQVTLDLTKVVFSATLRGTATYRDPFLLRPRGYVSFTASGRAKPFIILAEAKAASQKGVAFDSRRLERDDIFAVTLLRPGAYRLLNDIGKYDGHIIVAYPVIGDRPYRPPLPFEVECSERGFQPDRINLQPGQGLIFRVRTASRVRIALERPDDGPTEGRKPTIGISREATRRALERLRELRKNQT